MKLLFDQNISFRVVDKISQVFPDAKQVRELGLENAFDIKIWEYAKNNEYTIVTFDADFYDLASLQGHPPKIIWLRFGNTTTSFIAKIFIEKQNLIEEFINGPDYNNIACLEIDQWND